MSPFEMDILCDPNVLDFDTGYKISIQNVDYLKNNLQERLNNVQYSNGIDKKLLSPLKRISPQTMLYCPKNGLLSGFTRILILNQNSLIRFYQEEWDRFSWNG